MTNMINILIDEDISLPGSEENISKAIQLSCLMAANIKDVSLCMRFSNNDVVQQLNAQWRDKDKVTDVLSFPMQEKGEIDGDESLGDIIMAAPFISDEAKRLNLSESDHVIHLTVHGTLHLLGYDHIEDDEAQVMQQMENKIMIKLGLHQPYPEFPNEVSV